MTIGVSTSAVDPMIATSLFSADGCAVLLQEKYGFFLAGTGIKMQQAIEQRIASRIYGNGRGWAFSQADFADLGARSTIDSALHRREREGVIRRVIRGIYDYPRHSRALGGPTSPNIDQVAHALARKFAWRIQPTEPRLKIYSDCRRRFPRGPFISPMVQIVHTL
jgi:hypothetical protein